MVKWHCPYRPKSLEPVEKMMEGNHRLFQSLVFLLKMSLICISKISTAHLVLAVLCSTEMCCIKGLISIIYPLGLPFYSRLSDWHRFTQTQSPTAKRTQAVFIRISLVLQNEMSHCRKSGTYCCSIGQKFNRPFLLGSHKPLSEVGERILRSSQIFF